MTAYSGVERRRLKYAATINDEALSEETDADYELQYVDIGSVDSLGNIHDIATYPFADAPSRARRRVRDGDVIISCVRTYLQAIAPVQDPPDNLIVSTGFAVVRPCAGVLDTAFGRYVLREPSFLAEVEKRSVGVSYPAVNASDLSDIPVHLPPEPDQRAIADYLDRETARLDALVAAKERVLALLAEKHRALITRAVTRGLDGRAPLRDSGTPWLGEIPAHWEIVRLRFLMTDIEQGWSPEAAIVQPGLDEWGVLKLNAVSQGRFDERAAKTLPPDAQPRVGLEVHPGDVLVTRSNTPSLVGDACFVETTRPKLMLSDIIYRLAIRTGVIDGRFLVSFLILPLGRIQIENDARGTSASMVKISQEHIKNWWIPVPPIAEQRSIIAALAGQTRVIDQTRARIERTVALIKERRSALIAAAVTGQIDIRSTS